MTVSLAGFLRSWWWVGYISETKISGNVQPERAQGMAEPAHRCLDEGPEAPGKGLPA